MNHHEFKSGDSVTHRNISGNVFQVLSPYVLNAGSQNPGLLCRAINNSFTCVKGNDYLLWLKYLRPFKLIELDICKPPVKPKPTVEQIIESSKRRDARVNNKVIRLQTRIATLTKQMRDLINKNNAKRRRTEQLLAEIRNG